MVPEPYTLRRFRPEDFGALARIEAQHFPTHTVTGEILVREALRLQQGPHVLERWTIEDRGGVPVAFGHLASGADTYHPRQLYAGVAIDVEHEGRGLGRRLATEVEVEAARRQVERLWAYARADVPRALRFVERRGFRQRPPIEIGGL